MKMKSHQPVSQLLSTDHVQKLGLNWQELFNPSLAIHANREINISNIKLIGFDMDYTIVTYKRLPMESLQYDLAKDHLINNLHYPAELMNYKFDPGLLIRGLVIDKKLGNILKLDDQNYVWRSLHCHRELSPQEILEYYGIQRIKVGDERYYSLDTFFSIPEACLFIHAIECFYEIKHPSCAPQNKHSRDFSEIFHHIRLAMDTMHSDGSLKSIIASNIEEFIMHDADIEAALRKLKTEGKQLFLLTNSDFQYTNAVLNYVFNKDKIKNSWQDLFDLIIV